MALATTAISWETPSATDAAAEASRTVRSADSDIFQATSFISTGPLRDPPAQQLDVAEETVQPAGERRRGVGQGGDTAVAQHDVLKVEVTVSKPSQPYEGLAQVSLGPAEQGARPTTSPHCRDR